LTNKKYKLAKHQVPDYDVQFKDKYLYHEMILDPLSFNTISLQRNLTQEEKFLLLLDRGMESQHIGLLYNLKDDKKQFFNEKYGELAENGKFFFFGKREPFKDKQQCNDIMNAAMALIQEKALKEAQKLFEEVLQHDSAFYHAILGLGMILDRFDQKNNAAEWYIKAYTIDPANWLTSVMVTHF